MTDHTLDEVFFITGYQLLGLISLTDPEKRDDVKKIEKQVLSQKVKEAPQ